MLLCHWLKITLGTLPPDTQPASVPKESPQAERHRDSKAGSCLYAKLAMEVVEKGEG
jgi:hypothetical protein